MQRPPKNNERQGVKPKPPVREEHSAGGVVFRRAGRQLLIGFIKDTYHKWTFPKGHLEKGETAAQAAVRETHEEMGLKRLRVISPLGCISIRFKDRYQHIGQVIQKRIDFFLMETSPEERGVPQRSEGIHVIRWVSYRQAVRLAGYKNIQPILKEAIKLLEQEETD
jgi:8-oxo-dGTP pyrophosphatase MutT (NUDIX family)